MQALSCAGCIQWTGFNAVFLSYLINAHDTTPWRGAMMFCLFKRRLSRIATMSMQRCSRSRVAVYHHGERLD